MPRPEHDGMTGPPAPAVGAPVAGAGVMTHAAGPDTAMAAAHTHAGSISSCEKVNTAWHLPVWGGEEKLLLALCTRARREIT